MRFMDQVRETMRKERKAHATIKTYCQWIRRFIRYHDLTHPKEMGGDEVVAYLNHLVLEKGVAAATQKQALNALVYMYKAVLEDPLPTDMEGLQPGKRRRRRPVVLCHQECVALIDAVPEKVRLPVQMLYGAGLRVGEALSIRIKDVDLPGRRVIVYDGKNRDRETVVPETLIEPIEGQIRRAERRWRKDLAANGGSVMLPDALHAKLPGAHVNLQWQFLFPSTRARVNPTTGRTGRWHLHRSPVQKAVKRAAAQVGITKRVTCHTLRHSFATELLRTGVDIRTIQRLLGHANVKTTMIYTHVLDRGPFGVRSPLDR